MSQEEKNDNPKWLGGEFERRRVHTPTLARRDFQKTFLHTQVQEIKQWLELVFNTTYKDEADLESQLRNGVQLCELLQKLDPKVKIKYNKSPKTPAVCLDNLQQFLTTCKDWKIKVLFDATDFYEQKNFNRVLNCLNELATRFTKEGFQPAFTGTSSYLIGRIPATLSNSGSLIDLFADPLETISATSPSSKEFLLHTKISVSEDSEVIEQNIIQQQKELQKLENEVKQQESSPNDLLVSSTADNKVEGWIMGKHEKDSEHTEKFENIEQNNIINDDYDNDTHHDITHSDAIVNNSSRNHDQENDNNQEINDINMNQHDDKHDDKHDETVHRAVAPTEMENEKDDSAIKEEEEKKNIQISENECSTTVASPSLIAIVSDNTYVQPDTITTTTTTIHKDVDENESTSQESITNTTNNSNNNNVQNLDNTLTITTSNNHAADDDDNNDNDGDSNSDSSKPEKEHHEEIRVCSDTIESEMNNVTPSPVTSEPIPTTTEPIPSSAPSTTITPASTVESEPITTTTPSTTTTTTTNLGSDNSDSNSVVVIDNIDKKTSDIAISDASSSSSSSVNSSDSQSGSTQSTSLNTGVASSGNVGGWSRRTNPRQISEEGIGNSLTDNTTTSTTNALHSSTTATGSYSSNGNESGNAILLASSPSNTTGTGISATRTILGGSHRNKAHHHAATPTSSYEHLSDEETDDEYDEELDDDATISTQPGLLLFPSPSSSFSLFLN